MSADPETVIDRVAREHLSEGNLGEFIQDSFIEVLIEKGHEPHQTQARASVTGNVYELCLKKIFDTYYPWLEYEQDVMLSDACMGNHHGADFVLYDGDEHTKENIYAVIEAKGLADKLEWPDGTIQEPSRPGLQRTDTIKKAVCQAYQVKSGLGEDTAFFILTSHKPQSGNGKCIYEQAVGDIVDEVVDTTNKQEFDAFAQVVKEDLE
jgi:hypothetical protein